MQLQVVEAFHYAGTDYTVGQIIDTTTLPPRMVRTLLGRYPVATLGGGGGGTGGPETDPIATAQLTTHKTSGDHDAHNDTRLAPKVHTHTGTYEPAGAVATHTGAADPHGDRNYADGRIAALVNAAPAALDTLAEIDAQLSSDESGAAAMQASINTKAAAADLTTETNRATAAEQANTTALNNHVNAAAAAHAASAVSVNPAGLVVVTTNNVQAALAQLDAWANGRPTNESGTLAALPANGARPNNSTYFATDQNGGTTYRMVAGAWVQQSAGVTQFPAGELARASFTGSSAAPTTFADVAGCTITFTVGARPVEVWARVPVASNATAGGTCMLQITDNANAERARHIEASHAAATPVGLITVERISGAGTYTRKIRVGNNGSGGAVTYYGTGSGVQFDTFIGAYER